MITGAGVPIEPRQENAKPAGFLCVWPSFVQEEDKENFDSRRIY